MHAVSQREVAMSRIPKNKGHRRGSLPKVGGRRGYTTWSNLRTSAPAGELTVRKATPAELDAIFSH